MIIPPCPFCRADDAQIGAKFDAAVLAERAWHVECDVCHARGPAAESLREAVQRWGDVIGRVP